MYAIHPSPTNKNTTTIHVTAPLPYFVWSATIPWPKVVLVAPGSTTGSAWVVVAGANRSGTRPAVSERCDAVGERRGPEPVASV